MNVDGPMPAGVALVTPWGSPGLTTEEDLRAAQEYFFQTHATHARLIAEGRTAQGFMKSYTRRKLEKEMGEDFKMYTGQELGEGGSGEVSQGIRGELNNMLAYIYQRIAPDQPITSTLQEDVTILRHPQGALEVCFGMVFFYSALLKKHVTLASNRRKVLKSILDEELFKWIWRLSTNYLLSDTSTRINIQDYNLAAGLSFIPVERQRATMPQKLFEIGQFMLGKTLEDSYLRFPLAYYFATYLRAMQSEVLAQPALAKPEDIYAEVTKRKPMDPINHVLVAIDVLMNMNGNSSESFDDILKDEQADVERYIPPLEAQFLRQHDPYGDPAAFAEAVRRALPAAQRAEVMDGSAGSLTMRLLLVLRAVTPSVRTGILDQVPAPILIMLRNRLINGPQDDAARILSERLKAALDLRTQRGEQFVVPGVNRAGMGVLAASKPDGVPAGPEAPPVVHATGAAGSSRHEPAPRPPAAAAPKGPAVGAPAAIPAPAQDHLLDQRLLIGWRIEGGQLTVISLSPRELVALAGLEPRLVLPWVMLALQTGQAFDFPAASVNKELIEKLVKAVLTKAASMPPPRLGKPQVAQLVNDLRDATPQKALLTLVMKGQLGETARRPGRMKGPLEGLSAKFGTNLGEFLRSPSKDAFRDLRMGLTPEEKHTVALLQKLARLSA